MVTVGTILAYIAVSFAAIDFSRFPGGGKNIRLKKGQEIGNLIVGKVTYLSMEWRDALGECTYRRWWVKYIINSSKYSYEVLTACDYIFAFPRQCANYLLDDDTGWKEIKISIARMDNEKESELIKRVLDKTSLILSQ